MAVQIVRLGSARRPDEGLRIGTVRRPPRGVPKQEFASRNYYDVWFPILAPSAALVKQARAAETDDDWARFVRAYRREMSAPDAARAIALLAAMSHSSDFSVGCYCQNAQRCHRSVLRELLSAYGAMILPD